MREARERLGRTWSAYGEVLTGTEAVASFITLGLALASWVVELLGADDPTARLVATVLGWAGAMAGGLVIARGAVRGLLNREVNVDELVTIAIAASLYAGEYLGAALVAFMMLFGKVLEDVTAARADDAIAGLGRLVPATARVRRDDADVEVPVERVAPGDVAVVRPGERIPVDGVVASGRAWVEEAAITGEAAPASRAPGDAAFAGTLVTGGTLFVTVARTGDATTLGRIAALVAEATAERAPVVRIADRWATWFTPAVLALAAVTWATTGAFDHAVAVLVVACPCALTLATPTAIVATVARAARAGVLVRGGARVEAAGLIDVACLDKTGTLTTGTPVVCDVIALSGRSPDDILSIAAAVEARSEHPLGRAIVAAASHLAPGAGYVVDEFVSEAGNGVSAALMPSASFRDGQGDATGRGPVGDRNPAPREARSPQGEAPHPHASVPVRVIVGRPDFVRDHVSAWGSEIAAAVSTIGQAGRTPVAVAIDGTVAGVIALADAPRPEAATAVAAIRRAGVARVLIVTGDAAGPALAVARAAGIAPEDVRAGLLPEGKVAVIRELQASGHRVAMVGDGVNDAPALAAADLGIAMGAAGTDLAMAAADVVLLGDDLRQVARVVGMGRDAMATIRQNLWVAAAWNLVALGAAATGIAGIVAGALVHNVGSVGVVLNAARLVGRRAEEPAPAPSG